MAQLPIRLMIVCSLLLSLNLKAESCLNLASSFFESEPISKNIETLLLHAQQLKYTEEELAIIEEGLKTSTELDPRLVKSFLLFTQSFDEDERISALHLVSGLKDMERKNSTLQKFWKTQERLDKYEIDANERHTKALIKKKTRTSEINNLAHELAHLERMKYEKVTYSCMARQWNKERADAMKSYQKFVLAIGITSGIGGYTYAHFDEEKDLRWFGTLGYDLGMGLFFSYLKTKIITNPKNGAVAKGVQKWLMQRGFGVIDIGLYPLLFGPTDSEEQERLNLVLESNDHQQKINELLTHFEQQHLYQKIKNTIVENLNKVLPPGKSIINEPKDISDIDWTKLKKEDLKREDVQDLLLTASLLEYYDQVKGQHIVTGQRGLDRYVFNATYSAAFAIKDLPIDLWIYNTLCTGVLNPKLSIIKALTIYTIDKVIFDQVYFYLRKNSINM